jgi:hypothetical protein
MSAKRLGLVGVLSLLLTCEAGLLAQEEPALPPVSAKEAEPAVKDRAEKALADAELKIKELAVELDRSRQAQQVSAGILQPIYEVARHLSFPMFHWVAFAVMATGVVSYALQLVIGKLVVLSKAGFSPAEILSDALGLVISVVGLVLTTQAAAENSTFTRSPAAVLSASAVGVICGFIFYRWGQSQEVQATMARRAASRIA